MTLWELVACVEGYVRANSTPVLQNIPQEELDEMIEVIKSKEATGNGGQ